MCHLMVAIFSNLLQLHSIFHIKLLIRIMQKTYVKNIEIGKLKHTVGIKMLKDYLLLNDLSVETIEKDFTFHENETSNLQSGLQLANRTIHATNFYTDTIMKLATKIREKNPDEMKNISNLFVLNLRLQA